jgi:hypothetical protein
MKGYGEPRRELLDTSIIVTPEKQDAPHRLKVSGRPTDILYL